jgi:hypothetical protein
MLAWLHEVCGRRDARYAHPAQKPSGRGVRSTGRSNVLTPMTTSSDALTLGDEFSAQHHRIEIPIECSTSTAMHPTAPHRFPGRRQIHAAIP